jgi:hypothetical protein
VGTVDGRAAERVVEAITAVALSHSGRDRSQRAR